MDLPEHCQRLTIYLGEEARFEHKPLFEAIVHKAKEAGLAGATVLRGPMGFGEKSVLETTKLLRLSMDLPLLIQIIEAPEKIAMFLEIIRPMIGSGLVTIDDVRVVHYGRPKES